MTNDSTPPPSDSGSPFADDMAQYLQVYIDESEEELEDLIEAILKLENNPRHEESLHKAFRMLHSLKGSSGMLGFEVVGNFSHELEDRFERYRSGQAVLDRETTTLVLKCIDYFREFLGRLRAGDLSEGDPASLLNQLQALESRQHDIPLTSQVPTRPDRPTTPAMTVSGGLKIVVKFRPGLQLADLKARLIISRLSSIGEIVDCDPPIDDAHSFEELPLFSMTFLTDRKIEEVRKIANVDGVESVDIQQGELTSEILSTFVTASRDTAPSETSAEKTEEPNFSESRELSTSTMESLSDASSTDAKGPANETLRVDIGRLDRLMNLTGELVVANARFAQISDEMSPMFRRSAVVKKSRELTDRLRSRFDEMRRCLQETAHLNDAWNQNAQAWEDDLQELDRQAELWADGHRHYSDLNDAVDQLSRVSKNLQRGVLNTRMVPVGPLFNRFKRVIRDLSVERRKQVQLIIQGEKTELDKRMIDALGDPLLHLIRNSIDHGLESPEQRRTVGKSESGTIVLEAAHRGNSVWITVRDDGAGINTAKIRDRIVERGLAAPGQVREMSEAQAIDHIWHPGFSTAESVTEISGRGVGMDIVRNAISDLSGTIEASSTSGVGTSFIIRLPLTLAIIHSLMIRFRDDYFSIPLDDVREIVSIPRDQIHAIHRHVTIDVRGELIPLVSMSGVFQWASTSTPTPERTATNGNNTVNVVIIQVRGKTLGLTVDSLVGRSDLVIKSLSDNYQPVRGLSGASILGDGAVCLMLDSAALVEMASERAQSCASR